MLVASCYPRVMSDGLWAASTTLHSKAVKTSKPGSILVPAFDVLAQCPSGKLAHRLGLCCLICHA